MKRDAFVQRVIKHFTVIEIMLQVGDFYNGEEILNIEPVSIDAIQNRSDNHDYRYYRLTTTMNGETTETLEELICYLPDDSSQSDQNDNKGYDVVLFERECNTGLDFYDIKRLVELITGDFANKSLQMFPIELEARYHESVAMGFIKVEAAATLNYDYTTSGFHDFIASILDDVELADEIMCKSYELQGEIMRVYEFNGLKIWLNC